MPGGERVVVLVLMLDNRERIGCYTSWFVSLIP